MGREGTGSYSSVVKRRLPEGSYVPRTNRSYPGPNGDESDLATVLSLHDRKRDWNGYELLLWAALDDAIGILTRAGAYSDWDGLPAADRLVAQETKLWVASDDTSHVFSFVSICDYFALDPGTIRTGITRLRAGKFVRTRAADVGSTKIGADRQRWWTKGKKK